MRVDSDYEKTNANEIYVCVCVCVCVCMPAQSLQSCPTLCNTTGCSPSCSSVQGDSPGKNTGVGCHALLHSFSWTQEWNPYLIISDQLFFLDILGSLHSPPSQVTLVIKNPSANAGYVRGLGSIPGSGRSSRGGHGNPRQYSCLENPPGQRSLEGYSP